MKTTLFLLFAALLMGRVFGSSQQARAQQFQAAYHLEIGQFKLAAAIVQYQRLSEGDDIIAAKSLQRLVICYDQLGQKDKAGLAAQSLSQKGEPALLLVNHQIVKKYLSHRQIKQNSRPDSIEATLPGIHPKADTFDKQTLTGSPGLPIQNPFKNRKTIAARKNKSKVRKSGIDNLANRLLNETKHKNFIEKHEAVGAAYLSLRWEISSSGEISFTAFEGRKNESGQKKKVFENSDLLKAVLGTSESIQDDAGNELAMKSIPQAKPAKDIFQYNVFLKNEWLPDTYCRLFFHDLTNTCNYFFFKDGDDILFLFPGLKKRWNDRNYTKIELVLPRESSVTNPLIEAETENGSGFRKAVSPLSEVFTVNTAEKMTINWEDVCCRGIIVRIHVPGFKFNQTKLYDFKMIHKSRAGEINMDQRFLINYLISRFQIPARYFYKIFDIEGETNLFDLKEIKVNNISFPENRFSLQYSQRNVNFRLTRIALDKNSSFQASINELYTNETKATQNDVQVTTFRDIIGGIYDKNGAKFQLTKNYGKDKWNISRYFYSISLKTPLEKRGKVRLLSTLKPQAVKSLFSRDGEDIVFFMQPIKINYHRPKQIELVLPGDVLIRQTSRNVVSIQRKPEKLLIRWLDREYEYPWHPGDNFYYARFDMAGINLNRLELDSFEDVICTEHHQVDVTQNNKRVRSEIISFINHTKNPLDEITTSSKGISRIIERQHLIKIIDKNGKSLDFERQRASIRPWYDIAQYYFCTAGLDKSIQPGERLTYSVYYKPTAIAKKKGTWLYRGGIAGWNGNTRYTYQVTLPIGRKFVPNSFYWRLPDISINANGQQVLTYKGFIMGGEGESFGFGYQ